MHARRPVGLVAALSVALALASLAEAQVIPRDKPHTPGARRLHHGLALAPGDVAPRLAGVGLDGQPYVADFTTSRGTLVNLWATWCAPCKIEIPALQRLMAERGAEGLSVVGVLTDDVEDEVALEFVRALGATYPNLRVSPGVLVAWGGSSVLPVTLLIDGQGKVVRRYVGASEPQVKGLAADLDAFLAGKPLPMQILPETVETVSEPR